jgi:Inorganic Pyrophosphatase/Mannosyl-glycoprotein endo-beta-N-acetylglucosaminidase
MSKDFFSSFTLADSSLSGTPPAEAADPIGAITKVAGEHGVNPDYLVGLAKLETRLGDATIKGGGEDTRNLFNVKDFSGGGIRALDKAEGSRDAYRRYGSYEDSARDLVGLLERKYPAALRAQSPLEFAQALKAGGYATDPNYVSKLSSVIGGGRPTNQAPTGDDFFAGVSDEQWLNSAGLGGSQITDRPGGIGGEATGQERGWLDAGKDLAMAGSAGTWKGIESISNLFGADNAVSGVARDIQSTLYDNQSPQRQAERQRDSLRIKDAEENGSWWDEIKANTQAFVNAPIETTITSLTASAPVILAGLVGGGQAAAANWIARGAMGMAQGVGMAKGTIYEEVKNRLVQEKGMTAREAEQVATGAQAYDSENAGRIAINGLLYALDAGTGPIDSVLAGVRGGAKAAGSSLLPTPKSLLGRGAVGALKEMPLEGAQGGWEKYTGNKALQGVGVDVPDLQGVTGSAVGEALAVGPTGVVFGAMEAPPVDPALKPVLDKANEPNSPLSKAAKQAIEAGATGPTEPQADPITTRVQEVEALVRGTGVLDQLRDLNIEGMGKDDFLQALATARNTKLDQQTPLLREQALEQIENTLRMLQAPGAFRAGQQLESMGFYRGAEGTPAQQRADQESALERAKQVGQQLQGLGITYPEQDLQAQRDSALGESANAPGQAWQSMQAGMQPVGEVSFRAPMSGPVGETSDLADAPKAHTLVPAPQVSIPKDGPGTAQVRKRKAELGALVAQGFDTITQDASGAEVLANQKTGQAHALTFGFDKRLAKDAIQGLVRAAADQSPNSPNNDLPGSTEAQNKAGNYLKPPVSLNGFSIRVENPKGSTRSGTDPNGKAWSVTMGSDYGYISGTKAADGDGVDVYVGSNPEAAGIFVIDQVNPDGSFDEPKVVMGVADEAQARATYLSNYEAGWTGLGAITSMTREQFDGWLKNGGPLKPTALEGDQKPARATHPAIARLKAASAAEGSQVEINEPDPKDVRLKAFAPLADAFEKVFGRRPIPMIATGDGAPDGVMQGGDYFVNLDSAQMPIAETLAHELGHTQEGGSSVKALEDAIYALIPQGQRKRFYGYLLRTDNRLTLVRGADGKPDLDASYAARGDGGEATLRSEIIRDFMGKRFNDKAWLQRLAQEKPKEFGDFIREWIKLLDNLIQEFKGALNRAKEKDVDALMRSHLAELEQMKAIAIEVAAEWAKANPGLAEKSHPTTETSQDARYSTRLKSWAEGFLNHGKGKGVEKVSAAPSYPLRMAGLSALRPIVAKITLLRHLNNKGRKVDPEVIAKLPVMLAQPRAVVVNYENASDSSDIVSRPKEGYVKRFNVVTSVYDQGGLPYFVALHENGEVSEIKTMLPRENTLAYLLRAIGDGGFAWADQGSVDRVLGITGSEPIPFATREGSTTPKSLEATSAPEKGDQRPTVGILYGPQASVKMMSGGDWKAAGISVAVEPQHIQAARGISLSARDNAEDVSSRYTEDQAAAVHRSGDPGRDGDLAVADAAERDVADAGAVLDAGARQAPRRSGREGGARQRLDRDAAVPRRADTPGVYGEPRPGAVSVTGYHYSRQPRNRLSSAFYGTGLQGAERDRLERPDAKDIRPRIHFYVDVGNGVRPESGVGGSPHKLTMHNLYDANQDPMGLVRDAQPQGDEPRANAWERAILQAGFDGYVARNDGEPVGQVVLVGKHDVTPIAGQPREFTMPAPRTMPREPATPVTRRMGGKLVRKLTMGDFQDVAAARPTLKDMTPTFAIEYGEASVDEREAPAVNAIMEERGAKFRFSARDILPADQSQRLIVDLKSQGYKALDSDVVVVVPMADGKDARLTVNAREAMQQLDRRQEALEHVKECLL